MQEAPDELEVFVRARSAASSAERLAVQSGNMDAYNEALRLHRAIFEAETTEEIAAIERAALDLAATLQNPN